MTAAFRACYADWKLIKTRSVVQVVMEIPLSDADAAYEVLGGMPNPAKEQWFGIAAINLGKEAMPDTQFIPHTAETRPESDIPPARAKQEWREVQPSAQAAMRCDQAPFWAFLREEKKQRVTSKDDAATAVRKICGVNSRAHFNDNHAARVLWFSLDQEFQAWQMKERVGA